MNRAGSDAEEQAAEHLVRHGLKILARNYRCRGGEIDLVCRDGATLVFVEVRLRTHHGYGGAAASITPAKRRRITLAANHYLAGKSLPACRFDAVLFDGATIDWIKNAFDAT